MMLHRYFEQTINHEVIMLNKILKPIIGITSVQNVVLGNLDYYERLMERYISQASDLKSELVKMYETTKNDVFKALIGRLDIIEFNDEKEAEQKV